MVTQRQSLTVRVGGWLPPHHEALQNWLRKTVKLAEADPRPLHPVLEEFKALIEGDTALFMLFHQMFEQVPTKPPYNNDPSGTKQVRSYQHMLDLLNVIIRSAPEWNEAAYSVGFVGSPINAILDWPMGTPSGYAAFLNEKVNAQLYKVLGQWAKYLNSADSVNVLDTDSNGWFGQAAAQAMPSFAETFICDPTAPFHGFKSWDDFFTRELRPGVRPVACPDDDGVIVNGCEAAPYRIATNVSKSARFWVKAQPYSLVDMLAGDILAPQFVGGTVYQAFLSPITYHRWHSPVSGTVVKAYRQPGTYYSELPSEGFPDPDPSGPNNSQGYLAEVATRAMIFIQADNPEIGLMCFMPVGMAEVSTCEITVSVGQHVKKGEQLGMFHYGGSTYCLLLRPGLDLIFNLHGVKPGIDAKNINLCAELAMVRQRVRVADTGHTGSNWDRA